MAHSNRSNRRPSNTVGLSAKVPPAWPPSRSCYGRGGSLLCLIKYLLVSHHLNML